MESSLWMKNKNSYHLSIINITVLLYGIFFKTGRSVCISIVRAVDNKSAGVIISFLPIGIYFNIPCIDFKKHFRQFEENIAEMSMAKSDSEDRKLHQFLIEETHCKMIKHEFNSLILPHKPTDFVY